MASNRKRCHSSKHSVMIFLTSRHGYVCNHSNIVLMNGMECTGVCVGRCVVHCWSFGYPSRGFMGKSREDDRLWQFVREFLTHADCERLQSLSQVRTSLGSARAWLRSALNERMLESLLNEMLYTEEKLRYGEEGEGRGELAHPLPV